MLPDATLVLDCLVIHQSAESPDRWRLIVGEIKTYPDRGGYTDADDLALARAQAGVYVHGLRLVLDGVGATDHVDVSDRAFLVLTRPGSNSPRVRAHEDVRYQAGRAAKGFELLRTAAAKYDYPIPEQDHVNVIVNAPTDYRDGCVNFCDRASVCRTRAMACGDAAVLGDDVKRFLSGVRLDRALELLAGAPPTSAVERDVYDRLEAHRRLTVPA
jgi:hypothetical protein